MIIHCDVMLSLKIVIQVSFSPLLSCTYWGKFGDGWKNCRIQTTHRDIRFFWDGFNTRVYTLTQFSWFVFADKVRPKTPPVSISDHQKVRNWSHAVVEILTLWFFVTRSHSGMTRRRCPQVLGCPSLWAMRLTRRPSTRRTWRKRWSSWCWIRRRASRLLMVNTATPPLVIIIVLFMKCISAPRGCFLHLVMNWFQWLVPESEAADWEEELQQELQEYQVVTESDTKDDQWDQEIEMMLQADDG